MGRIRLHQQISAPFGVPIKANKAYEIGISGWQLKQRPQRFFPSSENKTFQKQRIRPQL